MNSHLGNKGYTILKKELTESQLKTIRKELTVKPRVLGNVDKTFSVYRENQNKIYVPRYYGISKFGYPQSVTISDGDDIHIEINGKLREYQLPALDAYRNHVNYSSDNLIGGSGLLSVYCGWGKTDWTILGPIATIKKKTLIIVNKTFLSDQWIERIRQYCPTAKIGKIQGQTIDIDGKDIVIAMLQSLSQIEYPIQIFSCFGLTIIDEVHHISAESFSKSLFKVVTKYMIGLSATIERLDGTTDVIKMFLGDIFYAKERSKDEPVVVRGITYKSQDPEFNEVETDYKGTVVTARMISKLCLHNHRSEFILTILKDMIQENPKQQIMMISSHKSILQYMFDAIQHKNICTVGYYVGGMKRDKLKDTESKQVVLATYSMASEALDIKTLTTLFMITPMTNIEQSVGRILREKHSFSPIVVDIIDQHRNFYNQWNKRKRFYKKQNYKIIQTDINKYSPDVSKWTTTFNPNSQNPVNISDESDSELSDSENKFIAGKCLIPKN